MPADSRRSLALARGLFDRDAQRLAGDAHLDQKCEQRGGEHNLNEMRDLEGGVEGTRGKNQNAPTGTRTGRGAG